MFQSHFGSIKTKCFGLFKKFVVAFQSHFGSIKTKKLASTVATFLRFNPTLVRLKRPGGVQLSDILSTFQSHFGSIKTRMRRGTHRGRRGFQSHFGSIKTDVSFEFAKTYLRFQSHFGSIKTFDCAASDNQ